MRIIGGKFRGRSLVSPEGRAARPTSDRVREALFNILTHGVDGFDVEGARVLDLFAGTGALGIEALSRGARYCLFVEDDADMRGVLRDNVEALDLTGVTKVWRRDATRIGICTPMAPYDLVFADPPYGKGLGEQALAAASSGGWLSSNAVCVLEERTDVVLKLPDSLQQMLQFIDCRNYGNTALHIFRHLKPSD